MLHHVIRWNVGAPGVFRCIGRRRVEDNRMAVAVLALNASGPLMFQVTKVSICLGQRPVSRLR
jgi:hypothetical protein